MNRASCFRKENLPPVKTFYERELGRLSRPSQGWVKALCPFHPDRHPSLGLHLSSGGFFCFSCGAKGGDLLDFQRMRHGYDFRTACQKLGAWQENNKRSKRIPHRSVPYLAMDFKVDGVEYHAEVNDEPTSELQLLRRFHAEAKDRLSELHQGDAEKFVGEEEIQWGILASSWELIQMELAEVPDGK